MTTTPADLQQQFARALLDPFAPIPADLCAWNGSNIEKRFAVYRNNVVSSLIDALADAMPVVRELVGEAFFRAMAAEFIRAAPPRSQVLSQYGAALPSFISEFEPARSVPYLEDMARLELARLDAYHAADTQVVSTADWQSVLSRGIGLDRLRLRFHPSFRAIRSDHAVLAIWRAHHGDGELGSVDPYRPQSVFVWRETGEVRALEVDEHEAAFAQALALDAPISTAAQSEDEEQCPTRLAQSLRLLMQLNVVTDLVISKGDES